MRNNSVVDAVADRAAGYVQSAQSKANDLVDEGSKALHKADKEAQKVIKANPYPAIGVALGVGFLLGVMFCRRS